LLCSRLNSARWSHLDTRTAFLEQLAEAGFGKDQWSIMQSLINAEKSDLFDVLENISFAKSPISREVRVAKAQSKIFVSRNAEQKPFLEFVLSRYIETGVEELAQGKRPELLQWKYMALEAARQFLGAIQSIRNMLIGFQQHLYKQGTAAYVQFWRSYYPCSLRYASRLSGVPSWKQSLDYRVDSISSNSTQLSDMGIKLPPTWVMD
jgi:hypothetical protein